MKKLFILPVLLMSLNSFANHSISDKDFATIVTFSPFLTTAAPFIGTYEKLKYRSDAEAAIEDIAIYDLTEEVTPQLQANVDHIMDSQALTFEEALEFISLEAQNVLEAQ